MILFFLLIIFKSIYQYFYFNKKKKLGACQKDFSLCFYDADDDFTFEKTIDTHK
jgi:hypothetical protein